MLFFVAIANATGILDYLYATIFLGNDIGILMLFLNLPGLIVLNSLALIASQASDTRAKAARLLRLESWAFALVICWLMLEAIVVAGTAWLLSMIDSAWRIEILLNQIRFVPVAAVLFSMTLASSKITSRRTRIICAILLGLTVTIEIINLGNLR
jgi:hypothetical protein